MVKRGKDAMVQQKAVKPGIWGFIKSGNLPFVVDDYRGRESTLGTSITVVAPFCWRKLWVCRVASV